MSISCPACGGLMDAQRQRLCSACDSRRLCIGDRVEKFNGGYTGPGVIVGETPDDSPRRYLVAHKIEGGTGRFVHTYSQAQLRLMPAKTESET